ncbi:MAG: hypothetical protein E7596_06335 [Ruminococcaceae bacterium]|nr:hypothetical protein [Oscillospiraceae bacterium]
MKYKVFKEEMHGYCRRCINKRLKVHFKHKDCEYWDFPENCKKCGEVKNIVIGIRTLSRWKMWFKK